MIAHPLPSNDIATLVNFARSHKRNIRIRSGGHSYEGYGVGKDIVLDLNNLNSVTINQAKNTVTVGAGTRQGKIYEALVPQGLTMVMGTCKTVGIGGFSLGGGYGMISRHHGMAVDNLVSATVIDAYGNAIVASETSHSDLFWGLRGAGTGNFGVVTQLEFKTHKALPQFVFKYFWNLKEATKIVPKWFELLKKAPDTLTFLMTLTSSNIMTVSGQFEGTEAKFQSILDDAGGWPSKPSKVELHSFSYMESVDYFAGKETTTRPLRFRAHAGYWEAPPAEAAIAQLLELINSSKNFDSMFCMFDSYGGAINRVPRTETAFVHRNPMLCSMQTRIDWKDQTKDKDSIDFILQFNEKMSAFLSPESYQNYMDGTRKNWQSAFYAENFPRLQTIKKKYDPENFFNFERSIPL